MNREKEYDRVVELVGRDRLRNDPIVVHCLELIRHGVPTDQALARCVAALSLTKDELLGILLNKSSPDPIAPFLATAEGVEFEPTFKINPGVEVIEKSEPGRKVGHDHPHGKTCVGCQPYGEIFETGTGTGGEKATTASGKPFYRDPCACYHAPEQHRVDRRPLHPGCTICDCPATSELMRRYDEWRKSSESK